MGRVIAALCALLVMPAAAQAQEPRIVAEKPVKDRVLELTVATTAFAAPTKLHVILPTGYDADPARRWPVTYFMAGTMNRYSTFVKVGKGDELSRSYPSIIVAPDANSGYWSDWYNGGAFGPPKYETFVIDELIPLIDARFRTAADQAHRAIFGISMGGYGAMMLAARHPHLFSAAATLSGAVDSNLQPNGAILSASSTFDGADADAIYGPRATQEVRWRGHNPTDLAANLRDMDLQVRSANGSLNPGIGEQLASADSVSCVVEAGVYQASVSLHRELERLGVQHTWKDYGGGCHSPPNFRREIADTLAHFERALAAPRREPERFAFRTIEPSFDIYGWQVDTEPARALEFASVSGSATSLAVEGSGTTTVWSPPAFRGLSAVDVDTGAGPAVVAPDASGRVRATLDLGPANRTQQYTTGGARGAPRSARVTLTPHARIVVRGSVTRRGARVCVRALGADIRRARVRVLDSKGRRAAPSRLVPLTAADRCRLVRRDRPRKRYVVAVRGVDVFGHAVTARRVLRAR